MKGTGLLVRTGKWARTVGWVCWPSAICSYLPFAVWSLEDISEGRNGREKKKTWKIYCVCGGWHQLWQLLDMKQLLNTLKPALQEYSAAPQKMVLANSCKGMSRSITLRFAAEPRGQICSWDSAEHSPRDKKQCVSETSLHPQSPLSEHQQGRRDGRCRKLNWRGREGDRHCTGRTHLTMEAEGQFQRKIWRSVPTGHVLWSVSYSQLEMGVVSLIHLSGESWRRWGQRRCLSPDGASEVSADDYS